MHGEKGVVLLSDRIRRAWNAPKWEGVEFRQLELMNMEEELDEQLAILDASTDYRVYFEGFAYHVTDGTFDMVIGYGDDDFESLLSALRYIDTSL